MNERQDRQRSRAVMEIESLMLQAVGNLTPHGSERIDHAIKLLTMALKKIGIAAGYMTVEPEGTFACPHCGVATPHEHVVDRRGVVHDAPRRDIVERLRASMAGFDTCVAGAVMAREAADEIERLRAANPGHAQCNQQEKTK